MTIVKNKVPFGAIGGHRCNRDNRVAMHFSKLEQYLQYSLALNLACLGGGREAVNMEQLRGVAMAG